ncbi:MAG: phosphoribosyltransferase, partial [Muribaculaceae bacterium]|nr:phosphoribosyltransferase [Muribaculaceae bacterium]
VNILIFDRNPLVGAPPLAAWRSPVRFSCIALTLQQENLSHFLFELPYTLHDEKTSDNDLQLGKSFLTLHRDIDNHAVGSQRENLPQTAPWRDGVENVVIQSSRINTRFPELHSKAKAGDAQSAAELVSKVVKPEKVKALAERYPNAIVAFVHAAESTGCNQLPGQYAEVFEDYGLKLSDVVQINKPGHTGADMVGRFIRRARFDGDVEGGREYIIVDDMFTMGCTLRDLKDYIESKGGKVVAVSTLMASRYGTALRPTEEQIKQINEIGITNEQLKGLGIADNIEGLTRQEAEELIVLANTRGNQGTSRGREEIVANRQRVEEKAQSDEGINDEHRSAHYSVRRGRVDAGGVRDAVEVEMPRITDKNRNNKDVRVQAMRAIGGNLNKLRQAMSKQREYDQGTVEQRPRFATIDMAEC